MSFSIPRITAGQATVQKLNAPIQAIQTALNDVYSYVSQAVDNKSAIIQYDAVLDSSVVPGDLVYYDTTAAMFKPALALLKNTPGNQGQSVQAQSSRVQGMVISLNPPCILRNGYYNSAIIQNTIGVGAQAGQYFLSPLSAGKATKVPGWNMRQPCLSYYGNHKFSMMCSYLAHDNHHHSYYNIKNKIWQTVSDSSQASTCGTRKYIIGSQYIDQMSSGITTIFQDGVLSADYYASGYTVWYKGSTQPSTDVSVFNVAPFAYGDSVVRSIKSGSLSVDNKNGTFVLQLPQLKITQINYADKAISTLTNNFDLTYSPIVSKLIAGNGISVHNKGSGKFLLNAYNADIDVPVTAQQIYQNGTQLYIDTNNIPYIIFPGPDAGGNGKTSAATIGKFFKQINDSCSVKVWLTTKNDYAQVCSLTVTWVPLQVSATSPIISATGSISTLSSKQDNMLKYVQTTIDNFEISGAGTLYATIQLTPSCQVSMHKSGFIVQSTDSDSDTTYAMSIYDEVIQVLEEKLKYNAKE